MALLAKFEQKDDAKDAFRKQIMLHLVYAGNPSTTHQSKQHLGGEGCS